MAGLNGLMPYPPRQEVANMSDVERINYNVRLNKQREEFLKKQKQKQELLNKQEHDFLQKPTTTTTPNVNNAEALSNIMELYRKGHPEENTKKEPTGGNPNGDLVVDLSNTNPKDGWGRLDGSDMDSGNSTPVAKPTSVAKSKPKVKTKTAVQKTTVVDDGKTKEWYENLANSSYANDKEHEADMKAYREMQAKATADNDGKSKEWYENLANSSYANDKKYEADMKAFRKMQADEIAKNGYYTDSQGVKVYAKPMTDKPKKENSNE